MFTAILSLRSGMDLNDFTRRRSSAYTAAQHRRASKDVTTLRPMRYTTPYLSTSSNTDSPNKSIRSNSIDSSVPLITLRISKSPSPQLIPSERMVTQIKKYRLEAEKYAKQGEEKASPIGSLIRTYTERRERLYDSEDTDSDTPKLRRHSYDSRCIQKPESGCSDRNCGD